MTEKIPLSQIFDHNINIIIGSGASYGAFPTLALKMKDTKGNPFTVETLATKLEQDKKEQLKTILFMYYYDKCINPIAKYDYLNDQVNSVLENYKTFIKTLLGILNRRKETEKDINIFTTNYDGFLEFASNDLLSIHDFVINDGASGFFKRYLDASNFNSYSYRSGIFDKYKAHIPQLNLIHLHGSIYWKKAECNNLERIIVDYKDKPQDIPIDEIDNFSAIVEDENKSYDELLKLEISTMEDGVGKEFWESYNKLPIVNPTKWKFYETVFEEHYYQMLRFMSYELEKPSSILITFGFSFADEHILNLVKRSLSNPTLRLFICCFDKKEQQEMKNKFNLYSNVEYIVLEENLDFTVFNQKVFTLNNVLNDESPQ